MIGYRDERSKCNRGQNRTFNMMVDDATTLTELPLSLLWNHLVALISASEVEVTLSYRNGAISRQRIPSEDCHEPRNEDTDTGFYITNDCSEPRVRLECNEDLLSAVRVACLTTDSYLKAEESQQDGPTRHHTT